MLDSDALLSMIDLINDTAWPDGLTVNVVIVLNMHYQPQDIILKVELRRKLNKSKMKTSDKALILIE